jgi:DNA-directed RNA polymerase specialized sigma24 family protein
MRMSSTGSVSHWLGQFRHGDPAAAQKLWERYYGRLVGLARKKLRGVPRRTADEEDVALSAFDSFWHGVRDGRFPQLRDRDNLWRILIVITARKALDLMQHERRLKRGGGTVRGESALAGPADSPAEEPGIQGVVGREPAPEFAAQVADECRRRLEELGDAGLRSVALWKLDGYTNAEIAAKLGCVVGTVERKLRVIRSIWDREIDP